MRVLLSTDTAGGVWTYTADLARALVPSVDVLVVTMGEPPDAAQRAALDGIGLLVLDQPLDWLADDAAALAQAGRVLADVAASERCDVRLVHAPALVQPGVPAVSVLHSDVATWWEAVRGGVMPPDLAWRAAATWAGCRASDAVITVSAPYADAVRRHCDASVTVVANGLPPRAARTLRRDGGVMMAGRLWDPAKGAATLDAAAGRMSQAVTLFGALDAVGGRAFSPVHARHGGKLSAAALRDAMDRTHIYASPALYEPFGLGAAEAAQSGMALVLSDIPTHRALWDGAAVFVRPGDVVAWATTLDGLLNEPSRVAALAHAASERVRAYTITATAAATVQALRSAARAYA